MDGWMGGTRSSDLWVCFWMRCDKGVRHIRIPFHQSLKFLGASEVHDSLRENRGLGSSDRLSGLIY
jgi:hypothetical protein